MIERAVTIVVSAESARVGRRHRQQVEPLVSAPSVSWAAAGAVTGVRTRVSAGAMDADTFVFPAKLAPLVAERLRGRGVPVRVEVAGRVLRPDATLPGGLIRFGSAAHPDVLVPRLVAGSSARGVLVGTVNRAHSAYWVRALRRAGEQRPVMDGREYAARTPGGKKVVVTSCRWLCVAQPHEFQCVVVPDARAQAGGMPTPPAAAPNLAHHFGVAAYGFVPAGMRLSAAQRLTLGSLFGAETWLGGPPTTAVEVTAEADPTGPA